VAKDEGFDKIASVFEMLAQVEEQNSIVLNSLLQKQKGNCLVCANCGYYKQTKRFWPHCPLCGKAKGFAHFEQQEL
jgi:rubrerythrin